MTEVEMKFTEDATILPGTRRTSDGYLVADVRAARTGIQLYLGKEVGKPEKEIIRVYRPEEEVFSKESLASYAHRPVTDGHPKERVTADNWKTYSRGVVGDEIARDGEYVRIPLSLMDAELIEKVEKQNVRQLSAGYRCQLVWQGGVTEDGEEYDAVQKNIRINHVAVVMAGRAGPDARIGDGAIVESWDKAPSAVSKQEVSDEKGRGQMTTSNNTVITVDGLTLELPTRDAQIVQRAVDKANADVKRLSDALEAETQKSVKAIADKDAEIAKKDAEIAKKDAEIEKLKKDIPDAAALDALAQKRGDLIATAKRIHPEVKTDGLTDADIRKAVVVAKLGDKAIEGKSEAYIDARFDVLAEDAAGSEEVRTAIRTLPSQQRVGDAATQEHSAYDKSVADLNSWREKQA